MKVRLIQIRPETSDVVSFLFEPEIPLGFKAGQFLRYVLPLSGNDKRGSDRWFTIASAPFEHYLQLTTRFPVHPSLYKQALRRLPLGAVVDIEGPEGAFVLADADHNYVFVAAGIGITPVRSILAQAEHEGQKIHATVLYATSDEPVLFKDELAKIARDNTKVSLTYLTDAHNALEVTLQAAIRKTSNPYVYLSGPEPMVEVLAVTAKKIGLDNGHIKTDFFSGYES